MYRCYCTGGERFRLNGSYVYWQRYQVPVAVEAQERSRRSEESTVVLATDD